MKRLIPILVVLLIVPIVGWGQAPAPVGKGEILAVNSSHTRTTARIEVTLDNDRTVVIYVPAGGETIQAATVASPGGKVSDKADAVVSISLKPGPVPGVSTSGTVQTPASVPVKTPDKTPDKKNGSKVNPLD